MTLPTTMRAVEITQPGGPEVLVPTTRPVPQPAAGEVLIKVEVAGVNRPDVVQRQGLYPPPPGASDLPGLEVSGTIAALGDGVTGWQVGDRVCALLGGGGYADYATAPAGQVLPVPDGLDMVQAAALPETVFTVWTNVVERAGLSAGESFLVHGGTSGIGTIAIQLAKALGATVFATAGGADKVEACRSLGADHAIDYKTQDFVSVVKEATGGKGVNVVLDMVGGDYLPRNIDCLALEGRHVSIAFLRGPKVEVNLAPIMMKRLTLTGSTLRARTTAQKAALAATVREKVWPLVTGGQVRPVIAKTFPLDAAADAHRLMESSTHIGKIMLVL
ncbi:NAD(P)H-quinone oxidoreductase [Niveispirillum cyanobacteriorum]|uniref:NAD(P)H-quinone oxidoreductase n=1 Tax=Niveispirillum cyanobacteriorum TaxID=1612173 RepID=A0A2K9NA76_9PROT|nr:NAD(P)H-quinone oxidoreductase [Niveispirillum cyanobacteriorum]AUN30041.1 NAD(P)H-quinone oxidoreductase [Niveispirillum cyanobacteriorum]GGE88443.1 NAD(P)H quinone oxidoreductase [Niveispirillum cyanobacteriorum]